MAASNYSKDENHETLAELVCSTDVMRGIQNHVIWLSALNIFLSLTALLGNVLILVALYKESSLHPPSKLLFRNVALTDLLTGACVQPLNVAFWIAVENEQESTCRVTFVVSFAAANIVCTVTLSTLTAISVDRLLALLLGLRYRQVVTVRRIYVTVTVLWILPIVATTLYFFNNALTLWYIQVNTVACLATSVFSYAKIFFILRHNRTQVQNHVHQGYSNQTIPLNIARYKKTVATALWVQLALIVCYLPNGIAVALTVQKRLTSRVLLSWALSVTLVYFNSSLNPILYCWRIREVKQAVKETIRQLHCCPSQHIELNPTELTLTRSVNV